MPEDRRMTISSSSHLAPDEVARHTFGTVRRGFDPEEVRAYLNTLAEGLRGVAEREADLRQALEEAEHRAANPVLDEETLASALGQETSRVLRSAHEAASEMVAKATAESERILAESREEIATTESRVSEQLAERVAQTEADTGATRRATEEAAAAILEEARNQASAIAEQNRQHCREMVDEAQALRARVLADLSRRRKVLHAQIEQLRAGREHLAETVRGVRHSIDVIADDLFKAEDEARLAAEAAGREAVARPDEGSPEEIASSLLAGEALARTPPMVDVLGPDAETGSGESEGVGPGEEGMTAPVTEETPAVDEPPVDEVTAVTAVVEPVVEVPSSAVEPRSRFEPVVEPVDGPVDEPPRPVGPDGGGGDPGTGGESKPSVDDLFAKIRASTGEGEEPAGAATTDDGGSGDSPPEEGDPRRARRDELIAPIVTALSRRLKRTLQDDHNDLLDRLRSGHSAWSLDLLTPEPEHHDIYATAALPFLEEAAQAGASYAGSEGTSGPSVDELLGVAHDLAETVIGPLRRQLADDGRLQGAEESEVAEHVGAAFREWKGARVERLAGDFVVAAFSAGSITGAGAEPGALLEWVAVAGPDADPCPDCEDNALTGPQPPGEEFPTGHRRPPAHPGCRCLLAPSAP